MLIVGIDIGSYFTTYAYSYEFEDKTFLKSAKYLSGFNLEKVVQNDTVYIIKKLLTLERNTDPIPKNFMFLSELATEKEFLNEIRKFVTRIVKIIPVDHDESEDKYFIVSYPRGLLKKPFSKIYLELVCKAITKGIYNEKQYKNAKVYFITDSEAFRQCYKELLIKRQKSKLIANATPGSVIEVDVESLSKKYSKSLILMDEKDPSALSTVDNKDFEKSYEELLDIDHIFNSLNDIDVETYKTLYIDLGHKEIRFHYSEFTNIIKPLENNIVNDLTNILIEQYLSKFCYNLTCANQKKLREQLKSDIRHIILPKFSSGEIDSYQHEFKYDMIHILIITKEMIKNYIHSSLLFDVIERIQENANSPITKIELCGGFAQLYYNYIKEYFPKIEVNISNINISVGCVYYQQHLLDKEKIVRNKYKEAKLDCKNQIEKLKSSLDEENLSLSFVNKEQLDFFHRQQEKQQQLIEKDANSPMTELDWMGNVHKKDVKEQEQAFIALIDKQRKIEDRIDNIKEKIKKVEEFSKGLDSYYENVVTSFANVSFDFFSSYSIVITSNESEEIDNINDDNDDDDESSDSLLNKKLNSNSNSSSSSTNTSFYFKKLGLTLDDTNSMEDYKNKKIEVVGSYSDLEKPMLKINNEIGNNSSLSASPFPSDDETVHSKSMNNKYTTNLSSPIKHNVYSSSFSNSQSSLVTNCSRPNRNALAALNSKFISFNLQSDRLKQKAQLIEENHTLGAELKKAQTKNFTLGEELAKVKQENTDLLSKNEQLQKQIEELTKKLQSLEQN